MFFLYFTVLRLLHYKVLCLLQCIHCATSSYTFTLLCVSSNSFTALHVFTNLLTSLRVFFNLIRCFYPHCIFSNSWQSLNQFIALHVFIKLKLCILCLSSLRVFTNSLLCLYSPIHGSVCLHNSTVEYCADPISFFTTPSSTSSKALLLNIIMHTLNS